jgi:predicted DNA-binding protein (MmcQ/YjbR family)
MQWGNNLLFRVGEKMFAIMCLDSTDKVRFAFKCTPEEFATLVEREGIIPAPYLARNHWVGLQDLEVLKPGDLKRLVRDSYQMVRDKLPKKVRDRLV